MIPFTWIDSPSELKKLTDFLIENTNGVIAMDFEEESNLHVYGEHLCLIQVFDGEKYYAIDTLGILKYPDGVEAIGYFLTSKLEKIMFDCSSDSAIVRKSLGIQLENIFDIRLVAMALGFTGNLTSLVERNLGIAPEDEALKHKFQRTNWMKRPLSEEQTEYALGDVTYLFELKKSLLEEIEKKLSPSECRQILNGMKNCAKQRHSEKPGWEKICNYKALSKREKVYIRYFFSARDALAKKANVPPTNIVEKQILVQMAKCGTWEGVLPASKMRYSGVFEQARLAALKEIEA